MARDVGMLANDTYLERYEGMQVSLPQSVSVTENYNLGATAR